MRQSLAPAGKTYRELCRRYKGACWSDVLGTGSCEGKADLIPQAQRGFYFFDGKSAFYSTRIFINHPKDFAPPYLHD